MAYTRRMILFSQIPYARPEVIRCCVPQGIPNRDVLALVGCYSAVANLRASRTPAGNLSIGRGWTRSRAISMSPTALRRSARLSMDQR